MADSRLVVSTGENSDSRATDFTASKVQSRHPELSRQEASASRSSAVGLSCVQDRLSRSNVSEKAAESILPTWRGGMQKQYNMYIKKWKLFCHKRDKDYLQAPTEVGLYFLTELVEQGLSYSQSGTLVFSLSRRCGH